ncbi:MAG: prevent-host-death protein [Gracilibacter sp. BRH_c7a]|nr:MAG: prevent-host-death protein [Gracilibacter sp. BRH_c7a]
MDLRKVFDCMISVSELGRGQASKVIQAIEEDGNPYIVVKNNKPQAVIISINDYVELMRAKDMLNNNEKPSQKLNEDDYIPSKINSLTLDEMSIFLNNEESD